MSLSWNYPVLRSFAQTFYEDLGSYLGSSFIEHIDIIRSIHTTKEWNDWQNRITDPLYKPYIDHSEKTSQQLQRFNRTEQNCFIKSGLRVDLGGLISAFRAKSIDQEIFIEEKVQHDLFDIKESELVYKDIVAEHVIFCEGSKGADNPFFDYLPFNPSKGEVLIIESDEINLQAAYKNKIFFVPMEVNRYWVGSYDRWKYVDEKLTQEGREELISRIKHACPLDFRIVEHKSAIRPTVKDRRPFLGSSPSHSNMWIFNGLGTKGSLLAPYYANQLASAIFNGQAIDAIVDIARFR